MVDSFERAFGRPSTIEPTEVHMPSKGIARFDAQPKDPFAGTQWDNTAISHTVINGEPIIGVKREMHKRIVRTVGSLGQGASKP